MGNNSYFAWNLEKQFLYLLEHKITLQFSWLIFSSVLYIGRSPHWFGPHLLDGKIERRSLFLLKLWCFVIIKYIYSMKISFDDIILFRALLFFRIDFRHEFGSCFAYFYINFSSFLAKNNKNHFTETLSKVSFAAILAHWLSWWW